MKNFSDPNGYIFCYDKLENNSFSANIRDMTEEKFFYEVEGLEQGSVEKYLSSLETSFKIAYDSSVKSIESPSEDSQRNLFLFIAHRY